MHLRFARGCGVPHPSRTPLSLKHVWKVAQYTAIRKGKQQKHVYQCDELNAKELGAKQARSSFPAQLAMQPTAPAGDVVVTKPCTDVLFADCHLAFRLRSPASGLRARFWGSGLVFKFSMLGFL